MDGCTCTHTYHPSFILNPNSDSVAARNAQHDREEEAAAAARREEEAERARKEAAAAAQRVAFVGFGFGMGGSIWVLSVSEPCVSQSSINQ